VFKPAEDVPHTGTVFVEILLEAGLPPDVIQLVHATARPAPRSCRTRDSLVSFTGSTETGSRIGEVCGRMHKRLSLEMGGKNAQIVLDDADLDLAVEGVLWGSVRHHGPAMHGDVTARLQRGIHDKMLARLADRVQALTLGDGRQPGTDVGP